MAPSAGREFWAGTRALAPLLVGVAPFGMIYGVLALANGLTPVAALAMSAILFAGSAQFLFCQLLGAGAPAVVVVAEIGLLNLRHALYSAALAPRLAHLPRRWKLALAYLLTDEAFAAISRREAESEAGPRRHWFYLGAGLALWGGWQLSTAAGVLLGARLPASWPLDFALPLTFIAIVVPLIRDRAMLLTAVVAGIVALLAAGLPFKLGLLAAALAGMAAGGCGNRPMSAWPTMIACGLVTFALRLSFIAAEGRVTFPGWFRVLLPFVPVATLTALVVPELLLPQGALWLSWDNVRLVAGLVAIVIAAVTRSVLWTLVSGFAVLALWPQVIG